MKVRTVFKKSHGFGGEVRWYDESTGGTVGGPVALIIIVS